MKRSTPLKRTSALKSDPAKTRAFIERGRGGFPRSRAATPPSDFRDNAGRLIPTQPKRAARKRRKPLRGPTDRERSEAWAKGKRPCAVCGAAAHRSHGHHIVTQQKLRQVAAARSVASELDGWASAPVIDFERIRWDRRNRLWLCERHHAAHHSRAKPITWGVLQEHAPKVFQFAAELGLTPWLERTYPRNEARP